MKAVSRRGAAVDVGAAVNPALLWTADTDEETRKQLIRISQQLTVYSNCVVCSVGCRLPPRRHNYSSRLTEM